jgi:hypothetical protein
LALRQAGIPQSEWRLINLTGDAEAEIRLTERLARNDLSSAGTDVIRVTGSGASTFDGNGSIPRT